MPRIRCRYLDCVYLEDGYCGTGAIELDPDEGCLTYTHIGEVPEDDAWEDDDELDEFWDEEDEELYVDEEEDEDWLEEEEF